MLLYIFGYNLRSKQDSYSYQNVSKVDKPCLEVIKLFSCSTQLSLKFQLLINTEIAQINLNFGFLLINVKMPTIVGI